MFNIPSFIGAKQPAISSGPVYCSQYQDVLTYAGTLIGVSLPNDAQKLLQNQLLEDLISAGIWAKLDTFAVFATNGNDIFALIDWKRLTTYAPNGALGFTQNVGFVGNIVSGVYIDTNFNPSIQPPIGTNQYTLNDASRFFWTPTRGNTGAFEGQINAGITGSRNNAAGSINFHAGTSTAGTILGFNVDGWHCMNRVSSATLEIYLGNNFTAQSGSLNSTAMTNSNQFILRSASNYGSHTMSIYGMGSAFNSAQNEDFYNAIYNYLTAI